MSAAALKNNAFEGFHAVQPRKDCPHCSPDFIAPKEAFAQVNVNDACMFEGCGHKGENWVCLMPDCGTVMCSRYVKSHMKDKHNAKEKHPICFSFADFSYWCYGCDDYVVSDLLDHSKHFYPQKFGEKDTDKQVFDKMRESKYQDIVKEEDESDDDEDLYEEEKKKDANESDEAKKVTEQLEKLSIGEERKSGKFSDGEEEE